MAMHRKPVAAMPTPPELLVFRQEDWPGPEDEVERWQCYRRWQDARRAYSKEHPDSGLGSVLDQLRFERLTRMGLTR
jgi:hypothetical protein